MGRFPGLPLRMAMMMRDQTGLGKSSEPSSRFVAIMTGWQGMEVKKGKRRSPLNRPELLVIA